MLNSSKAFISLLTFFGAIVSAHAESPPLQHQGVVEVRGAYPNTLVHIKSANKKTILCRGDVSASIGEVAGMTVAINAVMDKQGRRKKPCAKVNSFKILSTGSGNAVIQGQLGREGSSYNLKSGDKVLKLVPPVPAGLEKNVGKEVFLVLPEKADTNLTSSQIRPVSYLEFKKHPQKELKNEKP